jgi:leucyl-tRNA synthetase
VTVPRDADQAAVQAAVLALEPVQRALEGKPPRKVIVVPLRMWSLKNFCGDSRAVPPDGKE